MATTAPSHDPRRWGRRLGLTVVVMVTLVAAGVMLASDNATSTEFVIAAGVLGSLIASVIALYVNLVVLEPADGRLVDRALKTLQARAPLLKDGEDHRIRTLKPKDDYSRDEWIELLDSAHGGLFLVGHALNKWCTSEVGRHFYKAIKRLTSHGKPVTLIMLPPDGDITRRLGGQRELSYERRVRETLKFLDGVRNELSKEARELLDVRLLCEEVSMPYMLAGNEHTIITAAYPIAAQRSGTMLTLTVDADTPFGQAIQEDLRYLVANFTEPVQTVT